MTWNKIQNPNLIQRLTRRLGVRQAHVSPTFSQELQPVIIVDDVREHPDRSAGFDYFKTVIGDPAATEHSQGRLRNPSGSNVLVIPRFLSYEQTGAGNGPGEFAVAINTREVGDLASLSSAAGGACDPSAPAASAVCSFGVQALANYPPNPTLVFAIWKLNNAAIKTYNELDIRSQYGAPRIVILPGTSLDIWSNDIDEATRFTFGWTEIRVALET